MAETKQYNTNVNYPLEVENVLLVTDHHIIAALALSGATATFMGDEHGALFAIYDETPEVQELLKKYHSGALQLDALEFSEAIKETEAKAQDWYYLYHAGVKS